MFRHNIFWTLNRASADPTPAKFKLFSSSWGIPCQGATANSVSSSEVSLQISFHCRRKHREHTPALCRALSLTAPFPLSVSYLLLVNSFFFFPRWEKEKHHCTKYTGNCVRVTVFFVADDLKNACHPFSSQIFNTGVRFWACKYSMSGLSLGGDQIWSFQTSTRKMWILHNNPSIARLTATLLQDPH